MKCKACENDQRQGIGQAHGAVIACRRGHAKVKQWWEREPGYIKAEVKAELARAGREWWPRIGGPDLRNVTPIHSMTQKQLVAELKRQSARLAGQPPFAEAA